MSTMDRRIMARRLALTAAAAVMLVLGCADRGEPSREAAAGDVQPAAEGRSNYEGNQWQVVRPGEHAQYNQRQSLLYRGQEVYNLYCVGCHGERGDGKGPAAERLITQPRDFTSGIYKFRSTDSTSLPMESDLHRTITRGLSRVSMPAFPHVSEHDKLAVIQYIKSFYPQWDAEAPQRKLVYVPRPPHDLMNADRVRRGELVYIAAGCASCHGTDGRGTGATQVAYTDAWGHPQRPFDFTAGRLKGGDDPEDIYRTFHTGLRSIMPQYGAASMLPINQQMLRAQVDSERLAAFEALLATFPETGQDAAALPDSEQRALVERNSWDLVAYVLSLRRGDTDQASDSGSSVP